MQFDSAVPFKDTPRTKYKSHVNDFEKIKVGILGTGKIGVDLLVKTLRSERMDCVMFSGRNYQSEGIQHAMKLGVPVSDKSIHAFLESEETFDVIFDATSASQHIKHAPIFEEMGALAIDMTPSQVGNAIVPAIGLHEVESSRNISMISCGGQSSTPIAHAVSLSIPEVSRFHLKSFVSPNSIGPATLDNIDEYYANTKAGIQKYSGFKNIEVELIVEDAHFGQRMRNVMFIETPCKDLSLLNKALVEILEKVQHYVPGYRLEGAPIYRNDGIEIEISVEGKGDFLPKYAGNLDIINCAAIAVAEEYANVKNYTLPKNISPNRLTSFLASLWRR